MKKDYYVTLSQIIRIMAEMDHLNCDWNTAVKTLIHGDNLPHKINLRTAIQALKTTKEAILIIRQAGKML